MEARAIGLPLVLLALALLTLPSCAREEPTELLDLVAQFARGERASRGETPGSREMEPRADARSGWLFLPAGSAISFAFEAARESSLTLDRLSLRGEGVRLTLTLSSDSEPDLLASVFERPAADMAIELPATEGTAVRLTLAVEGSSPAPGDGALLTGPVVRGWAPPSESSQALSFERLERPHVVIYLVDTLRRDRLGSYGYERPVSPSVDEFAAGATVFERSLGQASWTKPSVASMWTGVWPPSHGATGWSHRLPESFETLPERLAEAGYQTAAFVTNINAGPAFGLDQGFEHLWLRKKEDSDVVNREVATWLDGERDGRPLLLYVHTMDPHAGYQPAEPFRSRFAPTAGEMKPWKPRWRWPVENLPYFSDLYDGEIAQNDAAFGELMRMLRERGLYDSSLILFLSDHGEEFREHGGWRHGRVLHYGSLDVPLIVKFPGQTAGLRSTVAASHVDVMPTVLDVTGLESGPPTEGQSLARASHRPVFSHLRLGKAPLQYSVVHGDWKLIRVHGKAAATRLFHLAEDPGETRDLSAELPARTALLAGLLRERLASSRTAAAEETELTDDLERDLRALGYLQ